MESAFSLEYWEHYLHDICVHVLSKVWRERERDGERVRKREREKEGGRMRRRDWK